VGVGVLVGFGVSVSVAVKVGLNDGVGEEDATIGAHPPVPPTKNISISAMMPDFRSEPWSGLWEQHGRFFLAQIIPFSLGVKLAE